MKINIPLVQDSYNSTPYDALEVSLGSVTDNYQVELVIGGYARTVEVDARALYRALYALYGDSLYHKGTV
jgi:hypothetical protein